MGVLSELPSCIGIVMDSLNEQPLSESDALKLATTHTLLRMSEVRYRRLFEAAQDGILLLNDNTAQRDDENPFRMQMVG